MFRVDNSTAAAALPSPGAVGPNPDSFFTDGDPGGGIPATIVPADWLNAIQEEVAHTIVQAGGALDKNDRTQLYTAIMALITAAIPAGEPDASETVKGIAEIATTAEANAGTDDSRIITPLKLKGYTNNQTLQNLTASRAIATTYTNSTGRPITLIIWFNVGAGQSVTIEVDGVSVSSIGNTTGTTTGMTLNVPVPSGSTYRATVTGSSINKWWEVR